MRRGVCQGGGWGRHGYCGQYVVWGVSAGGAGRVGHSAAAPVSSSRSGDGLLASVPWGKLLAGLAIAYGAWIGFNKSGVVGGSGRRQWSAAVVGGSGGGSGGDSGGALSFSGGNTTTAQLAQLAANTPSSDIVMYSATWCPNCTVAKSWMGQYDA